METDMGEMDIVERLREVKRGTSDVRVVAGRAKLITPYGNMMNEAADLIESLRSENERLGNLAKSLSEILDAMDREEAIIDVLADRDSWRDQCSQRDDDLARIAKERDDAMKALEPFAKLAGRFMDETSRRLKPDDHNVWGYGNETLTYGDFRRAAAIRQMGEKP